jgi:hypothetical protein
VTRNDCPKLRVVSQLPRSSPYSKSRANARSDIKKERPAAKAAPSGTLQDDVIARPDAVGISPPRFFLSTQPEL